MKHYTTTKPTTRQWLLTASVDGNLVDYEEIIESDTEPSFWQCYEIAQAHGCDYFTITELEAEELTA